MPQFPTAGCKAAFQRMNSPTSLLRRQVADECYMPPERTNEWASIVSEPPLDRLVCVSLCRCSIRIKLPVIARRSVAVGSKWLFIICSVDTHLSLHFREHKHRDTHTEEAVKRSFRGDDLMAYQLLLEFGCLSWPQTGLIWWGWVWSDFVWEYSIL